MTTSSMALGIEYSSSYSLSLFGDERKVLGDERKVHLETNGKFSVRLQALSVRPLCESET